MKKYRILALLLALVMVFTLTACGKDKKSDDPNHYELGDYTLDYKGSCIMYDEYGRDALVMTFDFTNNSKDTTTSAGWAITSKCMQNGVQLETAYVLADADTYESIAKEYWLDVAPGVTLEVKNAFQLSDMSEVTLEISEFWSSDTYTITVDPSSIERIENETSGNDDDWGDLSWVYDDEDTDDSTDEEPEEPVEEEPVASFTDWWDGDWYGWWIVDEAEGDYEGYYGYWWDAFARISVDDDMTGTIDIWDEEGDTDNLVGASVISFTANGNTEHGTMVAESGSFMGATFEPAEWVVDPADAPYDEMIWIQGTNVGDNGSYHYSIFLRPWGELWDDVEEADRPYYYSDWYLKFVEAGAAMPDKFDADASPEAGSSAATTAAFSGAMTPYSVDGATSNKTPVPISFSLPEGTWDMETIKFSYKIHLYNCPDADDAPFGTPDIWIELEDNEEKLNFYVDQYENLSETDGYTIGGIEMNGRKYDCWGYEQMQEYWGVLPSGAAVSIRLINMTDASLPEAYAILDTISFD